MTLIEVLISVAILAAGSVVVMQALARAAYVQMIVEQQISAYVFALNKMAAWELAFQEGKMPKELERGSYRLGLDLVHWEVTTQPVVADPQLREIFLRVVWQRGERMFEHGFQTLLRLPIGEAP